MINRTVMIPIKPFAQLIIVVKSLTVSDISGFVSKETQFPLKSFVVQSMFPYIVVTKRYDIFTIIYPMIAPIMVLIPDSRAFASPPAVTMIKNATNAIARNTNDASI